MGWEMEAIHRDACSRGLSSRGCTRICFRLSKSEITKKKSFRRLEIVISDPICSVSPGIKIYFVVWIIFREKQNLAAR